MTISGLIYINIYNLNTHNEISAFFGLIKSTIKSSAMTSPGMLKLCLLMSETSSSIDVSIYHLSSHVGHFQNYNTVDSRYLGFADLE